MASVVATYNGCSYTGLVAFILSTEEVMFNYTDNQLCWVNRLRGVVYLSLDETGSVFALNATARYILLSFTTMMQKFSPK